MASLYKKPVMIKDPVTGKKIKTKSKKWWGQFKDALGRLRRVPLAVDKLSAQAKLNELVRKVEREMAGLVDPTDEQRKRSMPTGFEPVTFGSGGQRYISVTLYKAMT